MLAGKDASRSLAKLSKNEEDTSPPLNGLFDKEMGVLSGWEKNFKVLNCWNSDFRIYISN